MNHQWILWTNQNFMDKLPDIHRLNVKMWKSLGILSFFRPVFLVPFRLASSKQLPLVAAKKTGSNQMCYKQKDNHTTYAIGGFGFSDIIPFSFVWNWLIPFKFPCFPSWRIFPIMAGPMFKPLSSSSSELSKEYSAAASRTSGGRAFPLWQPHNRHPAH